MMELFCENTQCLTIFATKAPSQMFDWVIYRPPKILKFFKVKLRWNKSLRLLQREAILALI